MRALVRLYPAAWRERHGDELDRLIEDRPPSLLDRVDILRGALDAQLRPYVLVGGPEPAHWTHRLPGLLALSAGLAMIVGLLVIAFGPGPDWGGGGDLLGVAFVLMLISLPGDYLAPFGGRIAIAFGCVVLGVSSASATDWWEPAVAVAIAAELVAVSGLLSMAAIRAGVDASRRWLLLAAAVLFHVVAIGAHALLRAATGAVLLPDGSSLAALALLPYGLAWLLVGVRMAVRGSPTIIDTPVDPSPAREVQPA
jgi:hypothetical protein